MLILAGVSIATLTGENGILTRANDAKEETEQAEKDEKTNLAQTEDLINQYVNGIEVEQVTDQNPGALETEGTDTYIINSIEDLVFFASDVRNGNTYEGKTVKLGLSLDFNSTRSYIDPLRIDYGKYGYDGELKTLLTSGKGFKPIGAESLLESEEGKIKIFKGSFDGNNNVIYGLYINRDITYDGEDYEEYKIGLFGYNEGTIKNIGLANNNISVEKVSGNCNVFAGGITGQNQGTIDNCYNKGNITTNFRAGGISGRNNGIIENTYNAGKILGSTKAGGISGDSEDGIFINCYNLGKIDSYESPTDIQVAGICPGGNSINKCYNLGNINATASKSVFVSGVGSATEINSCYNLGIVNGNINEYNSNSGSSVAGICAYWGKTINNCYNIGNITSNSDSQYSRASGIAYGCEVNNSYNFGTVLGIGGENTESQIGGISSNTEGNSITNSCNVGNVDSQGGKNVFLGSILGNCNNIGTITSCSYLAETAEKGMGTGTDVTTRVDNIEEMPNVLTILGSDFKEDTNNINNGYPVLN